MPLTSPDILETPEPSSDTLNMGVSGSLLARVMVVCELPEISGVKVIFSVPLSPSATVRVVTSAVHMSSPMVILLISILPVPVLYTVSGLLKDCPRAIFPKLSVSVDTEILTLVPSPARGSVAVARISPVVVSVWLKAPRDVGVNANIKFVLSFAAKEYASGVMEKGADWPEKVMVWDVFNSLVTWTVSYFVEVNVTGPKSMLVGSRVTPCPNPILSFHTMNW